jgi:hypothetical protein
MAQQRTAAWRRTDLDAGVGLIRLLRTMPGFRADGCEVAVRGAERWSCRFTVGLDDAWLIRLLQVEVVLGGAVHQLRLDSDGAGRWWGDGTAVPGLDGCLDVELAATPFTSSLPLHRLALQVGQVQRLAVARVDVPGLRVERCDQQYARLGPAQGLEHFRWWPSSSSTPRLLTVDGEGLPVTLERFAQRISPREHPLSFVAPRIRS